MEINSRKEKLMGVAALCAAPFIVSIILLIVYFIKGIYPFGTRNIAYFDMNQLVVPLYYRTWDVLHGKEGLFWCWNSGGGISMVDSAGNCIINPFNLFFLFVKRNRILESMSFFLILKMAFCAWSMSFYAKKKFSSIKNIWIVLFGLIYASCGFAIQYYSLLKFFDIVAIFPLIMLFVDSLLYENKCAGYIIMIALGFVTSVYLMAMVAFFVVFYVYGELKDMDKDERARPSVMIIISTICSLCLSAFMMLPNALVLLNSPRAENFIDNMSELLAQSLENSAFFEKLFMLYGTEVVIAVFLICIAEKKKKVFSSVKKSLRMCILMLIPISFELVNLSWHVGGYVEFPMRFGYMLTFAMLLLLGDCIKLMAADEGTAEKKTGEVSIFQVVGCIILCMAELMLLTWFGVGFLEFGIRLDVNFAKYAFVFIALILIYVFGITVGGRKYWHYICAPLVILQLFMGWYAFTAPTDLLDPACYDDIIVESEKIASTVRNIDSEDSRIARVRDESLQLNANYGFVLDNGTISNWTMGVNPNLQMIRDKMGYGFNYTRVIDDGETAFTDAFWHIRKIVSLEEPNELTTEKVDKVDKYFVSSPKYDYPLGILVNENMINWSFDEMKSVFQNQNDLFKIMNSSDSELISIQKLNDLIDYEIGEEGINQVQVELSLEGSTCLYLSIKNYNMYRVYVNDKAVLLSDLGDPENLVFPNNFRNGTIDLGTYCDEKIVVTIETYWPMTGFDAIEFGLLHLDVLAADTVLQHKYDNSINVVKNGVDISVDAGDNRNLLLQVPNANTLYAKVNGKKVTPLFCLDNVLPIIPLEEGENNISVRFYPQGLITGIILSGIGVVGLILLSRKNRKETANIPGAYYLIAFVEKGILFYLYLLQIVVTIMANFSK